MSHLAKALADQAVQSQVRQQLDHRPAFHVPQDLPDVLQEKLRRLDEVMAGKSKS